MKTLPEIYDKLLYIRSGDSFPSDADLQEIVGTYFPQTFPAFVQDMSDITAAFFGTMLAKAAVFWGQSAVDTLALATVKEMGYFKTKQSIARYPQLPQDARGVFLVLVAGIYSASPEYQFRIVDFHGDHVKAFVYGNDRYFRIAASKGVQHLVTWPNILHFLRGVNNAMGCHYQVDVSIEELQENGNCQYEIIISPEKKEAPEAAATGASFLRLEEHDKIERYGRLALVPLGKSGQYAGRGFSSLLRKAVSLEGLDYNLPDRDGKILYMLAESMSARKSGNIHPEKDCYAVIRSRSGSGSKKHAVVGILDEDHAEIYHFTFDYYLWDKNIFEEKFSFLKTEADKHMNNRSTVLPEISRVATQDKYVFRSLLPAFSFELCADHYNGFPCVPAIYIYQCLMTDNIKWLQHESVPEADKATENFMELSPVKVIPVGMALYVDTRVTMFTKKRFRFYHEIRDTVQEQLHLIVTADVSIG